MFELFSVSLFCFWYFFYFMIILLTALITFLSVVEKSADRSLSVYILCYKDFAKVTNNHALIIGLA